MLRHPRLFGYLRDGQSLTHASDCQPISSDADGLGRMWGVSESAATWFRRARLRAGYRSQGELARVLGLSRAAVANWESETVRDGRLARSYRTSRASSRSRPRSSRRGMGSTWSARSQSPWVSHPTSWPPSRRRSRAGSHGACARRWASGTRRVAPPKRQPSSRLRTSRPTPSDALVVCQPDSVADPIVGGADELSNVPGREHRFGG